MPRSARSLSPDEAQIVERFQPLLHRFEMNRTLVDADQPAAVLGRQGEKLKLSAKAGSVSTFARQELRNLVDSWATIPMNQLVTGANQPFGHLRPGLRRTGLVVLAAFAGALDLQGAGLVEMEQCPC